MNVKLLRAELRAVRRSVFKLTHHGLSIVGLVAVAVTGWTIAHPDYARSVGRWMTHDRALPPPVAAASDATGTATAKAPDAFVGPIADSTNEAGRLLGLAATDPADGADAAPARASTDARSMAGSAKDRQLLVRYLARKYRVNNDALAMLVDAAYVTGRDLRVDPILLLSVMAVESGFNPFAESTAGASGLMQLMSKVHSDKFNDFGGANMALNPVANLRVGAMVLKDCIQRGGSVPDGLRLYVGAGNSGDNGYGARVLQEKDHMLQALRGVTERPRIRPIPSRVKPAPDNGDPSPADKQEADDNSVAAL